MMKSRIQCGLSILVLSLGAQSVQSQQWTPTTQLPAPWTQHRLVTASDTLYNMGGVSGLCGIRCGDHVLYAHVNGSGSIGKSIEGASTMATSFSEVYYSPINADGTLVGWTATTPLPYAVAVHGAAATCGRIYVNGRGHC
jgi:hypothetical protein